MVEERRQAGVHQRDLDVATDTGLPSFVECSEHADGRVVAGKHVDDGYADAEGAPPTSPVRCMMPLMP